MNGRLVAQKMSELDFSEEDLASQAGCSRGTVRNMLRGRHTNSEYIVKAAKALGVSIDDLLSDTTSVADKSDDSPA